MTLIGINIDSTVEISSVLYISVIFTIGAGPSTYTTLKGTLLGVDVEVLVATLVCVKYGEAENIEEAEPIAVTLTGATNSTPLSIACAKATLCATWESAEITPAA